ncbi:MAG: hypothetical protein RSC43_07115, partial [Clostridia bacterium]
MQDDNFNGENNEYDAAPETPLPPTPSEAPETPVATPNVYDSPPEPPVFTGRADDAQPVPPSYTSHINMQVNERKKRRWLPITIGAIVLLYIILTAVLIGMVVHFARNGGL